MRRELFQEEIQRRREISNCKDGDRGWNGDGPGSGAVLQNIYFHCGGWGRSGSGDAENFVFECSGGNLNGDHFADLSLHEGFAEQ